MAVRSLIFLVEEQSMEFFLRAWLARILPEGCTFEVHAYRGKSDLLGKLESRLRGYAAWLPPGFCIIVVVDRDDDECVVLKWKLEAARVIGGCVEARRSRSASFRKLAEVVEEAVAE